MCGLAGFLDFRRRFSASDQLAIGGDMARALAHRGPDDQGVWGDANSGICLAHRRLSILDLSDLGHQPMISPTGRYTVAYNGELYNFEELRRALPQRSYRGGSDTEVILAAIEAWGLETSMTRFDGMFAFALWDSRERVLHLARDRFGEKPLYYGIVDGALVFGSELKSLREFPGFRHEVDRGAVAQLLRYGYIPAPNCITVGVRKLTPASYLSISGIGDIDREPTAYWRYEHLVTEAIAHPFRGKDSDAVEFLDALLRKTVRSRMTADVPFGAFLSGGIDSSTIVALMQETSGRKVKTFTIGFAETMYNEAEDAKRVAQHLGTEHTELYVSPQQARDVIPRLPRMYDEPFADASQIPTFLVSQLARGHVTMALSGDGGDELFGGYNRYAWATRIWTLLSRLPGPTRRLLARAILVAKPSAVDTFLGTIAPVLPARYKLRNPGDKLQKLGALLGARDANDLYFGLASTWKATDVVLNAVEPRHPVLQDSPPRLEDFTSRMMCADAITYLPDDILVKVDRAAMAVGLETRVPFLTPEVAAFAWSLPSQSKVRGDVGKWILREVLARYVPRPLFERPKMGFGVPIDTWLRGPLREWAEDLLDEGRLRREGYFRPEPIREKWREHMSGRFNWQYALWHILMFQSWLEATSTSTSGR